VGATPTGPCRRAPAFVNDFRRMKLTRKNIRACTVVLALATALLVAGCAKKKVAQAPSAPPPSLQAPVVSLSASPTSIQQGQSATLTWTTRDASVITISGLGTVPASGSRIVNPGSSVTYNLEAKGPGGSAEATARVTVNAAPITQASITDEDLFRRNVRDVYFDLDKYNIRADQQSISEATAAFLRDHPKLKIVIEGHCDDRGSAEYNLGLGDNRANELKSELVKAGIAPDRIKVMSYGKENPFCSDENEQCWQQNRRDHVLLASQ